MAKKSNKKRYNQKKEDLRYIKRIISPIQNRSLLELVAEEILEMLSSRELFAQEEGRFVSVQDEHIENTLLYRPKGEEKTSMVHSLSNTFAIHNVKGYHTIRKMFARLYKGKIINCMKNYDSYGLSLAKEKPQVITQFINLQLENNSIDDLLMLEGKALDAIGSNPYCKHLRIANIQQSMLESIPDDITLLYPEARRLKRQFYLHVGGTNSGKTYQALNACMKANSGVYLAPLRLLALECQEKMLDQDVLCSMITGEEENIIPNATHMSSTVELLNTDHYYDVCVIDEAQMLSDEVRGWAWTKAILGVFAREVHVCMSPDALPIVQRLVTSCADSYVVVEHERNTPLIVEDTPFDFPEDVKKHDALVVFSRRNVLSVASELKRQGKRASVIYGALPYDVRKNELHKFMEGETEVVVTTDAIGMGMNLPVERIVFLETEKFDGISRRFLTGPEIKQIAGRAGRKGLYEKGYVNAIEHKGKIAKRLKEPYKAIEKARIQMPDRLLDLDLPLVNTLKSWSRLASDELYEKASIEENLRRIQLIDDLMQKEEKELSKKRIWQFVLVPFDERNKELEQLYLHLIYLHLYGLDLFVDYQYQLLESDKLEELETNYKKLDLYFSFARILNYPQEEKERLMKQKAQVATKIMEVLGHLEGQHKTCRQCGRLLAWNYRYGICNRCHLQKSHGTYKEIRARKS